MEIERDEAILGPGLFRGEQHTNKFTDRIQMVNNFRSAIPPNPSPKAAIRDCTWMAAPSLFSCRRGLANPIDPALHLVLYREGKR